jgi:MoaA/NifB/PqqE/SkfB family radical SAM enzyme
LRKDFFDILATVKENDFVRITLATNGMLLSKYYNQINSSCITNVSVSLDSIGQENDAIRGVQGYYKMSTEGMLKINKKIKVVSIFTNRLIPYLQTMISLCKKKGNSYDINLPENKIYFLSSAEAKQSIEFLYPSHDEIDKGMKILKKNGVLPDFIISNAVNYLKNGRFNFTHCALGYTIVDINSNGNVYPGCLVYEPVGNIINDRLEDVIKDSHYIKTARKMYRLSCDVCSCNYGISASYDKPWSAGNYILKRIFDKNKNY